MQRARSARPVLGDSKVYLCDNGACYCGAHCGNAARYTGRDISGQPVVEVTPAVLRECLAEGWEPACEACGATASALVQPEGTR